MRRANAQSDRRTGVVKSMHSSGESSWYAIHVSAKKEKQVAEMLCQKAYECFLPVYTKRSMWSDRINITTSPLFSGYVFSRFDVRYRLPILMTPNVHGIVGAGKVPTAIPENDIEAIRTALRNGMPVEPYDSLSNGDTVVVTKGPLEGVQGMFIRYQGSFRLVLSLPLINRSVAVEMDRSCVERCSASHVRQH
jgi:transcription antitermination factor NusG